MICCFFFNDTATTEIYTLSLHDALPIFPRADRGDAASGAGRRDHRLAAVRPRRGLGDRWPRRRCLRLRPPRRRTRSEEHTSELQSRQYLVCRLLLEKKKK